MRRFPIKKNQFFFFFFFPVNNNNNTKKKKKMDSNTNPAVKRLKADLNDIFNAVVKDMMKADSRKIFHKPVVGVIGYSDAIKHPMCYSTVESKIEKNEYKTEEDFENDMTLIFTNCMTFNPEKSFWFKEAVRQHKLMSGVVFPRHGLTSEQFVSYEKVADDETSFLDSEKREAKKHGGAEALARARNKEVSEGLKDSTASLETLLGKFGDPKAIMKASKELLGGSLKQTLQKNDTESNDDDEEEEEDEESEELSD